MTNDVISCENHLYIYIIIIYLWADFNEWFNKRITRLIYTSKMNTIYTYIIYEGIEVSHINNNDREYTFCIRPNNNMTM